MSLVNKTEGKTEIKVVLYSCVQAQSEHSINELKGNSKELVEFDII